MTTEREHQHVAVRWLPTQPPSRTASGGGPVERHDDWRLIGRDLMCQVESTVAARAAGGRAR